jgi:hypothetical protein
MSQATDALLYMAESMSQQMATVKEDSLRLQNAFFVREQQSQDMARRMLEQKDAELVVERQKLAVQQREMDERRRVQDTADAAVVYDVLFALAAKVEADVQKEQREGAERDACVHEVQRRRATAQRGDGSRGGGTSFGNLLKWGGSSCPQFTDPLLLPQQGGGDELRNPHFCEGCDALAVVDTLVDGVDVSAVLSGELALVRKNDWSQIKRRSRRNAASCETTAVADSLEQELNSLKWDYSNPATVTSVIAQNRDRLLALKNANVDGRNGKHTVLELPRASEAERSLPRSLVKLDNHPGQDDDAVRDLRNQLQSKLRQLCDIDGKSVSSSASVRSSQESAESANAELSANGSATAVPLRSRLLVPPNATKLVLQRQQQHPRRRHKFILGDVRHHHQTERRHNMDVFSSQSSDASVSGEKDGGRLSMATSSSEYTRRWSGFPGALSSGYGSSSGEDSHMGSSEVSSQESLGSSGQAQVQDQRRHNAAHFFRMTSSNVSSSGGWDSHENENALTSFDSHGAFDRDRRRSGGNESNVYSRYTATTSAANNKEAVTSAVFSDDNFGSESGSNTTQDSMTIQEKLQALAGEGMVANTTRRSTVQASSAAGGRVPVVVSRDTPHSSTRKLKSVHRDLGNETNTNPSFFSPQTSNSIITTRYKNNVSFDLSPSYSIASMNSQATHGASGISGASRTPTVPSNVTQTSSGKKSDSNSNSMYISESSHHTTSNLARWSPQNSSIEGSKGRSSISTSTESGFDELGQDQNAISSTNSSVESDVTMLPPTLADLQARGLKI